MPPQQPIDLSGLPDNDEPNGSQETIDLDKLPDNEMPDANKMLQKGMSGMWRFFNTSGIPEPTEEQKKEHPVKS